MSSDEESKPLNDTDILDASRVFAGLCAWEQKQNVFAGHGVIIGSVVRWLGLWLLMVKHEINLHSNASRLNRCHYVQSDPQHR